MSKSWVHIVGGLHYPMPGVVESHFICVQTNDDMASGRASTSGHHFGGIVWAGSGEREKFEARQGVYALGHIHENAAVPTEVVSALSAYGVAAGDGLRDVVKKLVAKTGIHNLSLGEI
jgi:hypothetical protein